MSKGNKRTSNKEVKKPKQAKKPAAAPASAMAGKGSIASFQPSSRKAP